MSTGEQIITRSRAHAMRLPISDCELRPAAGAEVRLHADGLAGVVRIDPRRVEAAALVEMARAVPEILEVAQIGGRERRHSRR